MYKTILVYLSILTFSHNTIFSQKVFTYTAMSGTNNLNVNGAYYKKFPMVSSTELFGNIDNAGNFYSYVRTSPSYIQVYKNGVAFKGYKDAYFGNVSNTGNVYTYRIDTGKLKVSMNQTLIKTITLSSGEVYGETDDAGNVYTFTYTSGTLTIRKNGSSYRSYTKLGTFGSVDNSGNIYSYIRNTDGSISTYRNGLFYVKTIPPLSSDLYADCR